MNLRKANHYDIGLDIGTGSVGWAVTDENGELFRFKGKPTWGSRLFPSAETAEKTRLSRGQRRRYDRRRQRLDLLQGIFVFEMEKEDPDFFIRLNQSRLWKEDRDPEHQNYRWPLFNGGDLNEVEYYQKFPTIYHLRSWLTETNEKADIRLIYLAFHNIIKYRGNFLHQENAKLSAKNANMHEAVSRLDSALKEWCEAKEIECACKAKDIEAVFDNASLRAGEKKDALISLLGLDKDYRKMATALSKAFIGYKAEFADIFFIDADESSFKLSEEEKVEAFLSSCPDDGLELFNAMQAVHSSYVLMGILNGGGGETISFCKVREYERYGRDLTLLKSLVKKYAPAKYDEFFRGEQYEGSLDYDSTKARGYTLYNLGSRSLSYDDFLKEIKKLFEGTAAEFDGEYPAMLESMENGTFLRRLKTSENGSIPYQLHLEEMEAIIDRQAKHYSFLKADKNKIESLVTFRIPYYVGPLTQKNAATNAGGDTRFAWVQRKAGMEEEKIYPWSWEDVIDKDASAEAFIRRMTGTCTYLHGEPVLARCSLMYEMYCVLNELNAAKITFDGDKAHRFSDSDRLDIIEEVFKTRKTVSYKTLVDWYKKKHGPSVVNPRVFGGQGETGFESKLSSYYDFCKILETTELNDSDIPMVEEIILWNTIFEDRGILRQRIKRCYGDRLTDAQIKAICKKRYVGWGKLSKTFLAELKISTDNGPRSIMDILAEGDPNHGKRFGRAMNLMEILHDEDLGFAPKIDEINREKLGSSKQFVLEDLQGSPALRRGVNQALRIVEEIAGIAGGAPANIYVEVTREEDEAKKGKRTKKRYDRIGEALNNFKKEDPEIIKEYRGVKPGELDELLTLYFMQRGRSMYSGKPLNITDLHLYQVDHIIPQAYIKDDSFENKVLVLAGENQRKLDSMLIENEIIGKMKNFWQSLHDAKLIGPKKFNNLMRTAIKDDQLKGFINRQLVETSQIVKQVQQILQVNYENTKVLSVKAGLSSQLRKERGLAKCREINDYHHAHDALLACQIGRFISFRHSYVFDEPVKMAKVAQSFIKKKAEQFGKTGKMPGSSSFIVASFLSSGFDKETGEIFKDTWNAEAEVERIRKSLNYKDCFISRMPEETSGTFWDETIYSPKGSNKALSLPLKKGLDVKKYGSYSSEKFAYFFIYQGNDVKKGRAIIKFEGVPVNVAASLERDSGALERYAQQKAEKDGLEFERLIRKKVLKYQVLELNNERFYTVGLKEVRSAQQIAFSQDETKLFCEMLEKKEILDKDANRLFENVQHKFARYASRLNSQLGLESTMDAFQSLSGKDKNEVLFSLISIISGKMNVVDMSFSGGSKQAGKMLLTYSKVLGDKENDVYLIDQSVTGMFERRQKVGL